MRMIGRVYLRFLWWIKLLRVCLILYMINLFESRPLSDSSDPLRCAFGWRVKTFA